MWQRAKVVTLVGVRVKGERKAMVAGYWRLRAQKSPEAVIKILARRALAQDKVLRMSNAAFAVEEGGDVVVVESMKQAKSRSRTKRSVLPGQEKRIVIPRQEAFECIAEAAQDKSRQLREKFYRYHRQTWLWFLGCAVGMSGVIINSVLLALLILIPGIFHYFTPTLLTLLIADALSLLAVALIFRQTKAFCQQVDFTVEDMLQVDWLCKTVKDIAAIPLDSPTKELLQEVLLVRSLGGENKRVVKEYVKAVYLK
ncbi:hypothetical protein [Thermosporothrix hazakensis]|uniref:hypothetical protein n=1 Tax=Thermosporothrix hazakensis TaxID=644383 RepID=UPI0014770490|nr:hypothetical protein [Thermosporothrix hazakensis]